MTLSGRVCCELKRTENANTRAGFEPGAVCERSAASPFHQRVSPHHIACYFVYSLEHKEVRFCMLGLDALPLIFSGDPCLTARHPPMDALRLHGKFATGGLPLACASKPCS